jgi:hypothetical protein
MQIEVHGSNMTEPYTHTVPVRILVEEKSVFELAIELIGKISVGQKFRLAGAR